MQIYVADTLTFGGITFGQTDTFGCSWYLMDLDGWETPDTTTQMTAKASGPGGFASPAFPQWGTFTVTGGIEAPDRPTLIAAQDRLVAAASIQKQQVLLTTGGQARYSVAQRQSRPGFQMVGDRFTQCAITFVAEDPRKFGSDLTGVTGLPSATGGWTFPFTFPKAITSTVISGQTSLTNPGNATGPVKIRIDGPVVGPQITHVGSGLSLVLATDYTLASGSWLEIDMDAHTVLENGQAERIGYVTEYGWSGFDPGLNEWAFAAQAFNSSARMTVTATPAYQ